MPIVLVAILAAFALGWFDRTDCVMVEEPVAVDLVDAEAEPAPPSWQAQCMARFEEARAEAALDADLPGLGQVAIRTGDSPSGPGGVWYDAALPDGTRLAAGVSGPQPGDIEDADWYSLNGAIEPQGAFSWFRNLDGRSGAVAGTGGTTEQRDAFRLVFQDAIDDCLEIDSVE